jgi:2-methylcitrate dehydratase PrpD
LGICGSYAGGLVEYTLSGGSVKRIHTGLGARAGLEAALLAKNGLTGPASIIEGAKGMWAIFGRDKVFRERLLHNIGESYLLSTLMIKPYNCCYLIHPAIEGFLTLCKEQKLEADNIKQVEIGFSDFSISHAGKIRIPHDALGAQFSTSFTLALSLVDAPPSLNSYTQAALTDPEIIALAKKITVNKDETANKEFPVKNGCLIIIEDNAGRKYSLRIRDPKGSPENLLTEQEIFDKFIANTEHVLGREKAEALLETALKINTLSSVLMVHNSYRDASNASVPLRAFL